MDEYWVIADWVLASQQTEYWVIVFLGRSFTTSFTSLNLRDFYTWQSSSFLLLNVFPYYCRNYNHPTYHFALEMGSPFISPSLITPEHFSAWLRIYIYIIYKYIKKIHLCSSFFLLSHFPPSLPLSLLPSLSFSLTSLSPGTKLFMWVIIFSSIWLSVKISERFSWYRLNSSVP